MVSGSGIWCTGPRARDGTKAAFTVAVDGWLVMRVMFGLREVYIHDTDDDEEYIEEYDEDCRLLFRNWAEETADVDEGHESGETDSE